MTVLHAVYRVYSFLALAAAVKAPCNARMKHTDCHIVPTQREVYT